MPVRINIEEYRPPKLGLILLQTIAIGLFCVLAARFWYLQIHKGDDLAQRSMDNIQRFERTATVRGLITDVNGKPLAANEPVFIMKLNRDECHDLNATLAQISEWTDAPLSQVIRRYRQNAGRGNAFDSVIVCPRLTYEQAARISGQLVHWPGLEISVTSQRRYPYGPLFSHILGYVAEADARELRLDGDLARGDNVGKLGLEKVLERDLRGEKGRRSLSVDVTGHVLDRRMLASPQEGESMQLTIDVGLQQSIRDILGEQTGSVIVLDPRTGNVRAMVTTPSYDNNLFVFGISRKDWDELRNSPHHPMQNRAIQSAYPPGSIWKLVMAGLFLKEGTSTADTVFCNGSVKVGKQVFRCWHRGGHGSVDMRRSIVESCDVYYYSLGEQTGINKIEAYAKACGFGRRTGIDLPHENPGLVPSREWKEHRRNEPWYRGDTVNISIGQGSLLTTPIQVAVFVGSLLNEGRLMKPHIISGKAPEITGTTPMTAEHRKIVLDAMHYATMKGGTAKAVARTDARMGGKTGTAQVVKIRMVGERRQRKDEMEYFERDHAWFASWGSRNGEDVVVVAMIEHGGGGGATAGPVVKRIYDAIFGLDPEEVRANDAAIAKEMLLLEKEFAKRMAIQRHGKNLNPNRSALRKLEMMACEYLRH